MRERPATDAMKKRISEMVQLIDETSLVPIGQHTVEVRVSQHCWTVYIHIEGYGIADVFNASMRPETWEALGKGLLTLVRQSAERRSMQHEAAFLKATDPSLWGPDAS